MPEKPEAEPLDSHIQAVITDVAEPLLQRAANEIGHPLSVAVSVLRDGTVAKTLAAIATPGNEPQQGEMRLRFRGVVDENRRIFFLEALFPPDERAPTFSGFFCRGDVRQSHQGTRAQFGTWVVKREDLSWTKWL